MDFALDQADDCEFSDVVQPLNQAATWRSVSEDGRRTAIVALEYCQRNVWSM